MADFRAAGNAIGNSSKGPKRVILLIIVLVILIFVFRHKIVDTYHNVTHKVSETFEEVKGKFGTPVISDEPTGGNVKVNIDTETADSVVYIITEETANIREDAGVDHNVITTVYQGEEVIGTGREKSASNGKTWYEVYISEEQTNTGWISAKRVKKKE